MSLYVALEGFEARYAEYAPGDEPQFFRIDPSGALHVATVDTYTLCLMSVARAVPCVMLRDLSHLSINGSHVSCPSKHTVTRYEIHRRLSEVNFRTSSGAECHFMVRVVDSAEQNVEGQPFSSGEFGAVQPQGSGMAQQSVTHPAPRLLEVLPGDSLTVGSAPPMGGVPILGRTIAPAHVTFDKGSGGALSISAVKPACAYAVNGYARVGTSRLEVGDWVTVGRNTFYVDERLNVLHDAVAGAPGVSNAFVHGLRVENLGVVADHTGEMVCFMPEIQAQPGELVALLMPQSQVRNAPSLSLAAVLGGQNLLSGVHLAQGRISIGEYEIYGPRAHSPHRTLPEQVGYVPLRDSLRPELTVGESLRLAFALNAPYLDAETRSDAITAALAAFHMAGLSGSRVSDLAPLQRRCAAIAQAVVLQPKLVLLEHGFGGLDADETAILARWLGEFARETDTVVAFSTHSVEVAERADVVVAVQWPSGSVQHANVAYVGSAAGLRNPSNGLSSSAIIGRLRRGSLPAPVAEYAFHPRRRVPWAWLRPRRGVMWPAIAAHTVLGLLAPLPRWINFGRAHAWPSSVWGVTGTVFSLIIVPFLVAWGCIGLGTDGFTPLARAAAASSISWVTVAMFALGLLQSLLPLVRAPSAIAQEAQWGLGNFSIVGSRAAVAAVRVCVQAVVVAAVLIVGQELPADTALGGVPFYGVLAASLAIVGIVGVSVGVLMGATTQSRGTLSFVFVVGVVSVALVTTGFTRIWVQSAGVFLAQCGLLLIVGVLFVVLAAQVLDTSVATTKNRMM